MASAAVSAASPQGVSQHDSTQTGAAAGAAPPYAYTAGERQHMLSSSSQSAVPHSLQWIESFVSEQDLSDDAKFNLPSKVSRRGEEGGQEQGGVLVEVGP